MQIIVWVAAGGAIGASARHLLNVWSARHLGSDFPWGTFAANIAGSFLMGMLIGALALKWQASQEVRALLATGFLGGFTTFSAFSLDFATLYERHQVVLAALYVAGSVGLSLAAIFLGLWLARTVFA